MKAVINRLGGSSIVSAIAVGVTILVSLSGYFVSSLGKVEEKTEVLGQSLNEKSERLSAVEERTMNIDSRLNRIESKLDVVISNLNKNGTNSTVKSPN